MSDNKKNLLLGAHMSIAGGLELSYHRAEEIGCTAMQIFTKSNRQWRATNLTDETIRLFHATQHTSRIQETIAHASYLINLGTADQTIHTQSIQALKQELVRCYQLTIPYLVLHPGSRGITDEQSCLNRISDSLNFVLSSTPGTTRILLENMAGQGSSVCYSFDQLGYIIKKSEFPNRIGVCFDTCHAFAAGYAFSTSSQYTQMWQEFNELIGIHALYVIHVNDSKKENGSRVDRHEDIGKGKIGLKAFEFIMNDTALSGIPKILETPRATLEDYLSNMRILRDLVS